MLPEPRTNHKPTTLLTTYQPHITTLHATYIYQPNTGTNLMHYYYKLLPTTYQPHTNHTPTTHIHTGTNHIPTTITMQPHTNHITNHILQTHSYHRRLNISIETSLFGLDQSKISIISINYIISCDRIPLFVEQN